MKVLITGATGMLGTAIVNALRKAGHPVVAAGRRPVEGCAFLPLDFSQPPDEAWWQENLREIDVVINAVGILRENDAQRFEALHTTGPVALFRGCKRAGVGVVLQISALGANDAAVTPYHLSKRVADDELRALGIAGAIVQPSLVYAPGGESATLFNQLAVLPAVGLPRGDPALQPVYIEDVVDGVLRLLDAPPHDMPTIAFVGAEALSMSKYLEQLRRSLGQAGPQWKLFVPDRWCLLAGRAAGKLPGSMLDEDNVRMLLRGNAADVQPFANLIGHPPRAVDRFLDRHQAAAAGQDAILHWLLPALRWSVAAMWIWTAAVSFGLYPVDQSLRLLADFGLAGQLAWAAPYALYTGAMLDLVLGIACLVTRGRAARVVWMLQAATITAYSLLISVRIPEWWLHPFGPLSKNIPLLAVIVLLWALERRR